eukprot:GHVU01184283.1.p1 GENE.GHVU01184283.1~~GHVU01184283.1.p1  ORF type:complete len:126 (+),score=36.72 GHVU01184283.1:67-444(+)
MATIDLAVKEYRDLQESIQSSIQSQKVLLTQQSENELALEELACLESDAVVYKLVGPLLVKEDVDAAKANVNKRLDYIKSETNRLSKLAEDTQEKMQAKAAEVEKMQKEAMNQVEALRNSGGDVA